MSDVRYGYIGLGTMGAPMARRLVDAFGQLVVYDTDPARTAALVRLGATASGTCKALAEQVDIILMSLPNAAIVEAVLNGPEGVLAGARDGMIITDLSTIGPIAARKFAAQATDRSVQYLDVPVGGGEPEAIAGTLALLIGGDAAALHQVEPALKVIGGSIHYIGESGMGQATKLAMNLSYGVMICGVSEASGILNRYGVPPEKFLEITSKLPIQAYFNRTIEDLIRDAYPAGFQIDLMKKDLTLAVAAGKDVGLDMGFSDQAQTLFGKASEAGYGGEHTSALAKLFREAVVS